MKPILFNTEMVRAILDGHKAVTRRVMKPQPLAKLAFISMGYKAKKMGIPKRGRVEVLERRIVQAPGWAYGRG